MVDNHEAVKVGDLEKTLQSLSVVELQFTADFPEAVVREGADELTLRRGEEGTQRSFTNTTNAGDNRWWPPLVDEDWHAICQAILKGIEGEEWKGCTTSMQNCTQQSTSQTGQQP